MTVHIVLPPCRVRVRRASTDHACTELYEYGVPGSGSNDAYASGGTEIAHHAGRKLPGIFSTHLCQLDTSDLDTTVSQRFHKGFRFSDHLLLISLNLLDGSIDVPRVQPHSDNLLTDTV